MNPADYPSAFGSKGGSSSSSSSATEDPTTLQSNAIARIVDIVADGHIGGLVDGWKSVYINGTPVMSEGGAVNVKGIKLEERVGTQDQDHVEGLDGVESETSVAVDVKASDPVVRTVSNLEADAVRVTIQAAQFTTTDKSTGDIHGATVELAVDVQPQGGAWTEAVHDTISEKFTATAQWSYRISLTGKGPWNIRVRRITPDPTDSYHVNTITWFSYADIVDGKFSWPGIAYYAIQFDSKQFGTSIPSRSYLIRGLVINVPDNYDPETRQYAGIWSGQFKQAVTDNPAWIFYDLLTNTTYGLGLTDVDRYSLYSIGKYCDEMVPDGSGGQEPRFTLNTVITSRDEAYTVLNNVASAFRGMYYWDGISVSTVQDAPNVSDGSRWFGPSNVVSGKFTYSSTDDAARHNVCCVTWNDPDQQFAQTVEVVEDPISLSRDNGVWKQTDITAFGCTSRGQARRLGLWTLYSERMESESVSFSVSVADADIRPGDVITVSDPKVVGIRLCGRLKDVYAAGSDTLNVDYLPDDIDVSSSWQVSVMMPDGTAATRSATISGGAVKIDRPLDDVPVRNAVWILRSSKMSPKLYRVTAVKEGDDSEQMTFAVAAIEYHPNKYAEVEQGVHLEELPSSVIPTGPVSPPTGLTVKSYTSLSGDQAVQCITVSWSKSQDSRATGYIVSARYPDDVSYRTLGQTSGLSFDVRDVPSGEWRIRVAATSGLGMTSSWALITVNVGNLLMPVPPDRVDITAGNRSMSLTAIQTQSIVAQSFEFRIADVALSDDQIASNARLVGEGTSVSADGLSPGTTYYCYVRGVNNHGVSKWFPRQAETTNNFKEESEAAIASFERPGGIAEQIKASIEPAAEKAAKRVVPEEVESAMADAKRDVIQPLSDKVDKQTTDFANFQESTHNDQLTQNAQISLVAAAAAAAQASSSTEQSARTTADYALAQRIDLTEAKFEQVDASVRDEVRARASAVEALTNRVNDQSSRIDSANASLKEESVTRANADSALSAKVDEVRSDLGGDVAAVKTSVSAVSKKADDAAAKADGASAIASSTAEANQQLTAVVNDNVGRIDTQLSAYADDQLIQNVQLSLNSAANATAAATVRTEGSTRVTADYASAQKIDSVSASVDDLSATVKTEMKAEVDKLTNTMSAMWSLAVTTVNGHPAAIGLQSGGKTSQMAFLADEFAFMHPTSGEVTYPVMITDGRTMINSAMIGNGVIGGYLRSDNYSAGAAGAGWNLNKDGSAELNNVTVRGAVYASSGSFKGDVEANRFVCRYDNGVLAIEIGELS